MCIKDKSRQDEHDQIRSFKVFALLHPLGSDVWVIAFDERFPKRCNLVTLL